MDIRTVFTAALLAAAATATAQEAAPAAPPAPATASPQAVASAPATAPVITPAATAAPLTAPAATTGPTIAPVRVEESARWTIGAGVGFSQLVLISSSSASAVGLLGMGSAPIATFSLERRLGERTWLVFGGSGSVSHTDSDRPPPVAGVTFSALTTDESEGGALSIGLRRVVTRPGALVDVSLQATVEGGTSHEHQEYTTVGTVIPPAKNGIRYESRYAAVTGGIAVERELTGGLAVRISTPLVGASWSRSERKDDLGKTASRSMGAFVTLSPRIELRLAF
jgi:hypothetical protein